MTAESLLAGYNFGAELGEKFRFSCELNRPLLLDVLEVKASLERGGQTAETTAQYTGEVDDEFAKVNVLQDLLKRFAFN